MSMNVRFLRGTQNKLNTLTSYVPGAFYITDEDRLYFAQGENDLAYLNKSITTVNNVTELFSIEKPIVGEFYYVKDGNILCYYSAVEENGEPLVENKGNWIQVNVNTDTDTIVSGVTVSDAVLSEDKKALEMTCTISRTNIDGTELAALSDTFKITGDQINSFVEKVIVDVSIGSAANSTVIALGGQGTGSVELAAGNNVSLDGSVKDKISISAVDTTYGLSNVRKDQSNASAEVILKDNSGTETAVAFEAGNNDVEVSAAAGKIIVSHKDYDDISKVGSNAITEGKFKAITGITTANGHVTEVEEKEFTLPQDLHVEEIKIGQWKEEEGGENHGVPGGITAILNDGTEISSNSGLYYTIDNTNYLNQSDLTTAIKDLIFNNFNKVVNAMTFRGAINNGIAPTEGVSIGDTWIVKEQEISVVENSSVLEETAKIGDVIIASGTEDFNTGYIGDDLTWIVVPGTEIDTTYTLYTTNNNEIVLEDNVSNKNTINVNDDGIVVLETINENKEGTITYSLKGSHKEIEIVRPDPEEPKITAYGETISVITNIEDDEHGHITKIETTDYTLPGTHQLSCTIADVANGVSLTHQLADDKGNGIVGSAVTDSYVSTNGNLQITKSKNDDDHAVIFNLVWEDF